MEHRLRLALSRIWVAARRFGFFTLRCMVRRLGIAPNERKPRSLYRRARLFNGIPPRNGCRGRSCTGKERLMRSFGELSLPANLEPVSGYAPDCAIYRTALARFAHWQKWSAWKESHPHAFRH